MFGIKIIPSETMQSLVVWSLALISVASGFYLPGLAPTKFCTDEDVKTYVMDCKVFKLFLFMAHLKCFA